MRRNAHVGPRLGPMGAAKIRREKVSFGHYPWGSAKERTHKG
jgi:hypothetical protein